MNILDTHNYKLRFRIDRNIPPCFKERWNSFKYDCESGNNEKIIEQIKSFCKIDTNKKMLYLQNKSGGLGYHLPNSKQIIFRSINHNKRKIYKSKDHDIVFEQINSSNNEKWTYEELDDLVNAFVTTANAYIQSNCVHGCIELTKCISFYNNFYMNSNNSLVDVDTSNK